MVFNPEKHHRKGLRLKNYDYSEKGQYFLTLIVQHRKQLLGEIIRESDINKMLLNNAGIMVEQWYLEMENKYTNIKSCLHTHLKEKTEINCYFCPLSDIEQRIMSQIRVNK